MSEKTETTEFETFMGKLNEAFDSVSNVVGEYAEPASQAVLTALQLEAIFYLTLGAIFLFVAGVSVRVIMHSIKQFNEANNDHERRMRDEETPYFFLGMGAGTVLVFYTFSALLVVSTFSALLNLLNVTYWITAFSPELGLAYRAINGIF